MNLYAPIAPESIAEIRARAKARDEFWSMIAVNALAMAIAAALITAAMA